MKWRILPLVIFWLVILVIVALPDLRRVSYTPGNSFYPLIHKEHEDYYSYLSYIKQGRSRNTLVDQYTTRQLSPSLLHNYYLILGKIGKITDLSDIFMYRIGLYAPLIFYVFMSFRLVTLYLPPKYHWLALSMIFFASPYPSEKFSLLGRSFSLGAEWWTGLDIYSRLMMKPHHFISTALMMAAVYAFLKFLRLRKLHDLVFTGILMDLAMVFFAPPALILLSSLSFLLFVYLLSLLYGIIKKNPLKKPKLREVAAVILILICSLFIIKFVQNEAAKKNLVNWESARLNAPLESLPLLTYRFFLPLGILPLFFIPAFFYIRRKKQLIFAFPMLIIFISYLLFIFSAKGIVPIPMIRMIYYAPYVFGGLTAAFGAVYLIERTSKTCKRAVWICLSLLFFLNALWGLKSYWWPEVVKKEIFLNTYIPVPYLEAMDFLNFGTDRYSNVMSTFYTGMFIPAFTYNKVYIGHEAIEEFPVIWWTAGHFMAGKFSAGDAAKFLTENRIDYVFWDQGDLPQAYSGLMDQVYKNEYVTIYKIVETQDKPG